MMQSYSKLYNKAIARKISPLWFVQYHDMRMRRNVSRLPSKLHLY